MGSVPVRDVRDFEGFSGGLGSGFGPSLASSSSLVLDSDGRKLVKVSRSGKKRGGVEVSDAKGVMALKSHCEAERRRRERINRHLATLRSMVPSTKKVGGCSPLLTYKLDKAALLAEVINQVKELKTNAVEISKRYFIPSDTDEVRVKVEDVMKDGNFLVKASLCCEDQPELIADLRHTLQSLQLKMVRAEISALGSQVAIFPQSSPPKHGHRRKRTLLRFFLMRRSNPEGHTCPRFPIKPHRDPVRALMT
ncbi:hypothetical protein B296_00001546 [Ensete ventricosum]|uniref:BHLH domain-containing protein n=1 Tax=Ensete ventricosum TaxID=4639 RepID=A0A427AZQ3_ENSVE|nr:hypothetical protein B296_00001546 [Ensete ventricosum]